MYCLKRSLFRSMQASAFLYGKKPPKGKNLGDSFQLVLRVPPSPGMCVYVSFCLPCVPCFLGMSEDLGEGSEMVWRFASEPPIARRGCPVLKGLVWGVSFGVLLLDLVCYLELLSIPWPMSHFAAACRPLLVESIRVIYYIIL